MTYQEYFSKSLKRFDINQDEIDIILINQSLDASADVDVLNAKKAMFNEFSNLLPMANVSEGGLSVSWNIEALRLWYSSLANELGEKDILNQANDNIEDASYLF